MYKKKKPRTKFKHKVEFSNIFLKIDIQHFNLGTYGEGYVSPVKEEAVGQDHLLICTTLVTFWGKKKKEHDEVYQTSCHCTGVGRVFFT